MVLAAYTIQGAFVIQGDQKVSVHLMITIQKEVHRDFLITLYNFTHTHTHIYIYIYTHICVCGDKMWYWLHIQFKERL